MAVIHPPNSSPCPPSLQLTSLELQYVSPKLLMCRDLELAVPGTYDPNQPIIRIQSIAPSLQVITSKQRPRKLTIMGKEEPQMPCGGYSGADKLLRSS